MGDNIRLRGPLGLKQDLYDDKQAKEFKRIFQLTPKEIIIEFNKRIEEPKKEKDGGYMKRIPRKPGQAAGSKKHSDLYTDENPKGTIKGLKFATEADAKASVAKIRDSGRSRAHKIQAAVAMEQRAGVMGKASAAGTYRKFIDANKVDKKSFGGLFKKILFGENKQEDNAAPFRQTFNVLDSETGENRNIMQDFKPTQGQNTGGDKGLIGRLFGAVRNRPSQSVEPLKHNFYVKGNAGQNVNLAEKKNGGMIDFTKDKKYYKGLL